MQGHCNLGRMMVVYEEIKRLLRTFGGGPGCNGPSEYIDNWLGDYYEYLKVIEERGSKQRKRRAREIEKSSVTISLAGGSRDGRRERKIHPRA